MNVSVFDLFKLGVGPSSSHTMGPMTAASRFLARLGSDVERTARVETSLYASLALTGRPDLIEACSPGPLAHPHNAQ